MQLRMGKNGSLLTLSALLFMLFYNFLIWLTALLFVQSSKQMTLVCDYKECNRYLSLNRTKIWYLVEFCKILYPVKKLGTFL